MREIFYFRHFIAELQNVAIAAILKLWGAKGYGLYWYLLERLFADKQNRLLYDDALLRELAKVMKMEKDTVEEIIEDMDLLGLIAFDGDYIKSKRVENEVKTVLQAKSKRVENCS